MDISKPEFENLTSFYTLIGQNSEIGEYLKNEFITHCKGRNSIWPNAMWIDDYFGLSNERLTTFLGQYRKSDKRAMLLLPSDPDFQANAAGNGWIKLYQWQGMTIGISSLQRYETDPILKFSLVNDEQTATQWLNFVSTHLFNRGQLNIKMFDFLRDNGCQLISLILNEQIIGSTLIYYDPNGVAGVFMVCVDKEFQGKGFGKQLMNFSFRLMQNKGIRNCVLQSTKEGQNLYRSIGFQDTMIHELYIKYK
ncbi:MAG: GNAT family N-acetyltransferase [Cyclobacteriaceae bacterium]|nr:GNAT family N-acetyltransferase [Cyclobacteriaceae bacterium]